MEGVWVRSLVGQSRFNGGRVGSIAGWAAKIPHALPPKQTKNRSNIRTNSIKTFKTVHIKYVCMYIYTYIYIHAKVNTA